MSTLTLTLCWVVQLSVISTTAYPTVSCFNAMFSEHMRSCKRCVYSTVSMMNRGVHLQVTSHWNFHLHSALHSGYPAVTLLTSSSHDSLQSSLPDADLISFSHSWWCKFTCTYPAMTPWLLLLWPQKFFTTEQIIVCTCQLTLLCRVFSQVTHWWATMQRSNMRFTLQWPALEKETFTSLNLNL